jgi:hypothetical protein
MLSSRILLSLASPLQVAIVIRPDLSVCHTALKECTQTSARILEWMHVLKRCTICMNVCMHIRIIRSFASPHGAGHYNGRTMHALPLCAYYLSHVGGTTFCKQSSSSLRVRSKAPLFLFGLVPYCQSSIDNCICFGLWAFMRPTASDARRARRALSTASCWTCARTKHGPGDLRVTSPPSQARNRIQIRPHRAATAPRAT